MRKVTIEQFLNQLGIEVGKPFNAKGNKLNGVYIIVYFEETEGYLDHYTVFDFNRNEYEDGYGYSLEVLLDCEIMPLPKYILNDYEKAIVELRFIGEVVYIYRDYSGLISIYVGDSIVANINNSLFKFIENGQSLPIEELRKYL